MKRLFLLFVIIWLGRSFSNAQPTPDKNSVFTDARDGKKYQTVKIGNQVWMAQNLNFNMKGSTCFENQAKNCDTYGKLYEYDAAVNACPADWHLPSELEWDILGKTLDLKYNPRAPNEIYSLTAGNKLKSTNGWVSPNAGVSNETGFSALPSGWRDWTGEYYILGRGAGFWTSTKSEKNLVSIRYLHCNNGAIAGCSVSPVNANAIRCIKNQ